MQAVSNFKKDWLSFDMSWMQNKDGIVKPTWNKAVAISCDFLAHSPQTTKELGVKGYNKAYEYMNSGPPAPLQQSLNQKQKESN